MIAVMDRISSDEILFSKVRILLVGGLIFAGFGNLIDCLQRVMFILLSCGGDNPRPYIYIIHPDGHEVKN